MGGGKGRTGKGQTKGRQGQGQAASLAKGKGVRKTSGGSKRAPHRAAAGAGQDFSTGGFSAILDA